MVFSSLTFLALFLPAFLIVYHIIPSRLMRLKNLSVVIFSLIFYAAGEPVWVLLLLFSGVLDYTIGLFMTGCSRKWQSGALLALSLCGNLGLLLVFKYGAFFLGLLGVESAFNPALPIGISFYSFQTMSYTIDLYKGNVKPQRDPIAFLAYVSMFPQLVAGPIVRYADVEEKLTQRKTTITGFSDGVARFAMGLGKKVIFANHAGKVANELLGAGTGGMPAAAVWLGALMFMFQIYFDFSGYSDMAIGLGKMIGIDFKENFDHPYEAKSITEFWRKWHISLSGFFRDYVYIPLGGNRRRAAVNMLIVWFITGLWHGASVNFVLWGLYYFLILLLEKYVIGGVADFLRGRSAGESGAARTPFRRKYYLISLSRGARNRVRTSLRKIPAVFAHLYSLILILFGWLIFYYTDLTALSDAGKRFFGFAESFTNHRTNVLFFENIWIIPVLALFCTRAPKKLYSRFVSRAPVFAPIFSFLLLCFCFALLVGQSFNPFLYFRF